MPTPDASTIVPTTEEPLKNPAPHDIAGFRILVVDDNLINCQVAVHTLEKLGCHAEATTAGHHAIEMHQRQHYNLILMDCQMPGMDGYQTTAQIRGTETGDRHTVIIGWTSTLDADEWENCISAGMDDMIAKPIRPEAMREIISRRMHSTTQSPLSIQDEIKSGLEGAQQRFGSKFAELVALYQSDTPKRIAALRKAAVERDLSSLSTVAHLLSGSCVSIGAVRLGTMCQDLELFCKVDVPQNLELLLNEIEDEYAKANSTITRLLQSATV